MNYDLTPFSIILCGSWAKSLGEIEKVTPSKENTSAKLKIKGQKEEVIMVKEKEGWKVEL